MEGALGVNRSRRKPMGSQGYDRRWEEAGVRKPGALEY
jgi:hypothetical protein